MEVGVFLSRFQVKKKGKKKHTVFLKWNSLKHHLNSGSCKNLKTGFERYFHWDNTVVSCVINSVDDWCCEKEGEKRVYAPIIQQNHVSK